MLQEYLRADLTVSDRCSGAMPANTNRESTNTRSHEATKRVEDFNNAWTGGQARGGAAK